MEGIWYAHFTSGEVHGQGLAVLHDGKIEGGDPTHMYTGSYREDGPHVYADVCVSPYAGASLPTDITHPVTYFLQGSVSGNSARIAGHADNRPDVRILVELHKGE